MARLAQITLLALLICSTRPSDAQSKPAEPKDLQTSQARMPNSDLKMTTIGNGRLRNGHSMAFRIYEAPDGTDGQITYASFSSVKDARRQFKEFSKLAGRITSRERNQKRSTKAIDDRVVGSRILIPKDPTNTPQATEFLIIRRDTLNCYFIESMSLPTALRIEELID